MTSPSSDPSEPSRGTRAQPATNWQAYLFVALLTASVTGAVALLLRRPQPDPIVVHPPPTSAPTSAPEAVPEPIVVFVSGSVQAPANYELPADARVADAIDAAGGFTADADFNAVNQAERLWDGAQVHVPAMDEVTGEPVAGVSGETRSGGVVIDVLGKIDINSANLEQLETLPNIGAVKAQAIIDGRPYITVEDLERVDGIGPKTIEKLRELVEVR